MEPLKLWKNQTKNVGGAKLDPTVSQYWGIAHNLKGTIQQAYPNVDIKLIVLGYKVLHTRPRSKDYSHMKWARLASLTYNQFNPD